MTMATSSKPQPSTIYPATVPPKVSIVDSIHTIDISANSVIRKKVTQCLSILQIPNVTATATATATTTATTPKTDKKTKSLKKGPPKIIALKTVHPSAGSKAITIAEIVKRCIADAKTDGEGNEDDSKGGVWWQYTKLDSKLVELPPRKPTVVKVEEVKKTDKGSEKANEKGNDEPEVATNANKRKQDGSDNRASKKPKLDLSQSQNVDSQKSPQNTQPGNASNPNPRKRRFQLDDADEDSADEEEVPQHPTGDQDLQSDDSIPPHLKDAADDMDTDDMPPHLRHSSPEDVPPHLKSSSPGLYSDSKPGFLRDSSPVVEGGNIISDDIPPHLRGSSPVIDRDGSSTPKPGPAKQESEQMLTSSPPITTTDTPNQAQEDSNNDPKSDSSDDDEYRQFSYLDIEHLPEKHTKRILEDIDEAERNRKKYRAIAIMTIYLSLEKRGDLEKLYGGQTNAGEKRKEQEKKTEEGK